MKTFKDYIGEKEKNEGNILSAATDIAAQLTGLPSPTEMGIDLDNMNAKNFSMWLASKMDVIPLDQDTYNRLKKLCDSTPEKGKNFLKHQYNKNKACNILCRKTKSKNICEKAGCKKIQKRGRYRYNCTEMYPNDFQRDNNDQIIGAN